MGPNESYANVSLTAAGPLALRAGTKIPYAHEIARRLQANKKLAELTGSSKTVGAMKKYWGPYMEMRFRALSEVAEGYSNILELAAGFSPRGLIMSADSGVQYLESDQASVIETKESLAKVLLKKEKRPNLGFEAVDALNRDQVLQAGDFFDPDPQNMIVINEGLLVYLKQEEIFQVAKNISDFLSCARGAAWATTDITSVADFERTKELREKYIGKFCANAGRDWSPFETYDAAENLLKDAGFNVKRTTQQQWASQLTLSVPDEMVEPMKHHQLWIMTPRD